MYHVVDPGVAMAEISKQNGRSVKLNATESSQDTLGESVSRLMEL